MMDYNKLLSKKVSNMKPSGIRKFFDIAAEMEDVVSLGMGEPDFVTPWHIRDAGIYSLEKGRTYYTSNRGLKELRAAVAGYLSRRFSLSYHPEDEIVITIGGSEAIDNCVRAVVDPGDEVLIPEPSFVCYTPITELAGGVPVPVRTCEGDEFRLTPEALRAAITERTKLLILPFPNNPTGAIMGRGDLEAVADVIRGTDILVLSDEIYAELTYGQQHLSFASLPGMREQALLVSGFSKAYAMTGWRLGYACGPDALMTAINKIHQYAIMSAPTMSQFAAIEALEHGDEDVAAMREEYDRRRRFITDGFNSLGLHCFEPKGAFYVFPSIQSTGMDSNTFCERLLEKERLALVPGNAFGESGEGFVRVSYAYSIREITAAFERLERFLASIR